MPDADHETAAASFKQCCQAPTGFAFAVADVIRKGVAGDPAAVGRWHHGNRAAAINLGKNGVAAPTPMRHEEIHCLTARNVERHQRVKDGLVFGTDNGGKVAKLGRHAAVLLASAGRHKTTTDKNRRNRAQSPFQFLTEPCNST
jgi:hypothetical protein